MLSNMQVIGKYWAILHKGLEYVHIEMSAESLDRSLFGGAVVQWDPICILNDLSGPRTITNTLANLY